MTNTDLIAERTVLAGLYTYGYDAYVDIGDILNVDCFTDKSNQAIFNCISHLINKQDIKEIDQASLYAVATQLNYGFLFSDKTEREHLHAIINFPVKLDNIRKWAGKLKKLEIVRDMRAKLKLADLELDDITGDEPLDAILSIPESKIFELSTSLNSDGNSNPHHIADNLDAYLADLELGDIGAVGIQTPWPKYNKYIGRGFRRKTVSLMAARSGVGKTQIADNVGVHVAEKLGIRVLNLDTEMSEIDHWNRILANLSGVKVDEIEDGTYNFHPNKKAAVHAAKERLKKMPYDYLSIAGQPIDETISVLKRWVHSKVGLNEEGKTNDCLIILDYLKLMTSEGLSNSLQEFQALGFLITKLHNFMVQHDTACLAFVQLNRDGINKDTSDAVSGSDRLLWLCTNLAYFKEKTKEEIEEDGVENGNRKMIVVKTRHGGGMNEGDYINMNLIGEFGRITEGKTRYELASLKKNGSDDTGFECENFDTIDAGADSTD